LFGWGDLNRAKRAKRERLAERTDKGGVKTLTLRVGGHWGNPPQNKLCEEKGKENFFRWAFNKVEKSCKMGSIS